MNVFYAEQINPPEDPIVDAFNDLLEYFCEKEIYEVTKDDVLEAMYERRLLLDRNGHTRLLAPAVSRFTDDLNDELEALLKENE